MKEDRQKNPFPLRMEDDLEQWTKQRAKEDDRSVNVFINRLLRHAKNRHEAQHDKTA